MLELMIEGLRVGSRPRTHQRRRRANFKSAALICSCSGKERPCGDPPIGLIQAARFLPKALPKIFAFGH